MKAVTTIITITSAWLFRRSATTWTFVRKVGESDDTSEDDADQPQSDRDEEWRDGPGVRAHVHLRARKRQLGAEAGRRRHQASRPHTTAPVRDVEIDGGRIILGGRLGAGAAPSTRRIPSTGNWMARAALHGDDSGDNDNSVGGHVDISPNWAVVARPYNVDRPAGTGDARVPAHGPRPGRCTRGSCPSRVIPSAALLSATTPCSSATTRTSASGCGAAVVRTNGIAPTICVPPSTSPLTRTLRRRNLRRCARQIRPVCVRVRAGTPIAARTW